MMKKLLTHLVPRTSYLAKLTYLVPRTSYLVIILSLLTSCEFEASGNGDLDGFWQMTQLDTVLTAGTTDMREHRAFWAVQHHILELKHPSGDQARNVIFRFEHKGDSLILRDPIVSNRDSSDILVTTPQQLSDFAGIERLREGFLITTLDGDYMTLQSDRYNLHFRRY